MFIVAQGPFRPFYLVLLLFASLTMLQSQAKARLSIPFYSPGLQLIQPGEAKITGRDAYVILPVYNISESKQSADNSSQSLSLDLLIEQETPNQSQPGIIEGELFFRPIGQDLGFDPQYKIKFQYPTAKFDKIRFELPDTIALSNKELRLDFDNCSNCLIKHGEGFEFGGADSAGSLITPDRVFNGSRMVPIEGIDIDSEQWRINDMERVGDLLSATGGDPFMVSSAFDVDTGQLAGVLFEFVVHHQSSHSLKQNTLPVFDFQLFYSTEQYGFTENANTIFRVQLRASNLANSPLTIFIPLRFLTAENSQLLKQLRLDFANHSNQTSIDKPITTWNFKEARLIHLSAEDDYREHIPQQIFRSNHRATALAATIASIQSKLSRDPWFVVLFIALILLCSVLLFRRYRSTLKRP